VDSDSVNQAFEAEGLKYRYGSMRAPRVVEVPVTEHSCPLLPPPVQVVRNASPEQRADATSRKPAYLLLEFENRTRPDSIPFADLSELG
jgi:hypothetical protein